jgi:D-cysteine desulfhydrase
MTAASPTPVGRFPATATAPGALWFKNDGLLGVNYGGNKFRKLAPILTPHVAARRVLTFGSVGSHHVLSVALYGAQADLQVEAVVFPQVETAHVTRVVRASVATGAHLYPAASLKAASATARALVSSDTLVISPGPLGALACTGYADAVWELAAQVQAGELPAPDTIFVPAGSGGTVAGLLVGLLETGLAAKVVAVAITGNPALRALILTQAVATLRLRKQPRGRERELAARLHVTYDYLGRGYGYPTQAGERALVLAEAAALHLETTYTAKALAAARDASQASAAAGQNLLFWQTLSQHPLEPLLRHAPERQALGPGLQRLLLPDSRSQGGKF